MSQQILADDRPDAVAQKVLVGAVAVIDSAALVRSLQAVAHAECSARCAAPQAALHQFGVKWVVANSVEPQSAFQPGGHRRQLAWSDPAVAVADEVMSNFAIIVHQKAAHERRGCHFGLGDDFRGRIAQLIENGLGHALIDIEACAPAGQDFRHLMSVEQGTLAILRGISPQAVGHDVPASSACALHSRRRRGWRGRDETVQLELALSQ